MGQINPPVDLFEFPCDFPFKVFTDAEDRDEFCQQAITAVSGVVPVVRENLQLRPSSKGTYVCVTMTVAVSSREQVEKIYTLLRELQNVRYIL